MIAKTVTINLDKERHLKLTLGGMFAFRELTGKDLWNITNLQDFTDKEISQVVWACCLWEDRDLKPDDLLYNLSPFDFAVMVQAVIDCLKNAFTQGDNNVPLVGKSRNGSKSGLLHAITSIFQKRKSGN